MRSSIEIGEMSLGESKIAVETVQQNFERILQRLKMMLLGGILFRSHFRLCFQSEGAEISEQMSEDLQLIGCGEAIELQHDRWVE